MVSGDVIPVISPPFATAVAQLTSLRHVVISNVGHLSCFLRTVQSKPLRSISLSWLTYDEGMEPHEVQKVEYHPVALLSQWTSTLESLAGNAWFTLLELPVFPHTVYPKMRKLRIDWDDHPLVAPYIRAYLNLEWIDFRAGDVFNWENDEETLREHHELNVRSQSIAGTRWQELERVDGCLIDFYILGLVCPISRVNLRTSIRSEHDLEILSEVLTYAQPKELKIAAQILHTDHSFSELLRTAAGSRLENLLLHIDLSTSDRKVDIAAALERLGAALRVCPLRRLRLCVRAGGIDPTPLPRRSRAASLRRSGGEMPQATASDPPPPPIPLNLAERSLQAFDIAAYSRELGSAIASLTDAVFVIAGLRNDEIMISYIPPRAGVDQQDERTYEWEL
ncbi:hypothetical protein C8Q80DRAFT_1271116 [Daedaleopsis nitida]|nr:hypothetical protein C8Q80DRAFT_1271116 [Daedaleopsis nitida]